MSDWVGSGGLQVSRIGSGHADQIRLVYTGISRTDAARKKKLFFSQCVSGYNY